MRDDLLACVRSFSDELAERITIIVREHMRLQLEALATGWEAHGDVEIDGAARDRAKARPALSTPVRREIAAPGRARAGGTDRAPAVRADRNHAKATPSAGARKRKANTCSKCGEIGKTAQSCGKTHNVKVSPAAMPTAVKKSAPPIAAKARLQAPPGRSDRFAAIEAAAARRDDAKRERSERARSFIRSSGGRSRRASGAVDPDDDEEGALTAGGLPAPTASFDL